MSKEDKMRQEFCNVCHPSGDECYFHRMEKNRRCPWVERYIAGYEKGKEETIEKAVKWLERNATYIHPRKGVETCMVNLTMLKEYLED